MHKRAAYYSDKEIQDNKIEANLFDLDTTWEAANWDRMFIGA